MALAGAVGRSRGGTAQLSLKNHFRLPLAEATRETSPRSRLPRSNLACRSFPGALAPRRAQACSSVRYASLVFRFFRIASKMYYVYLFPYLASCSCIQHCLSQRPSSRRQKTKVLVNVFEIVDLKSYLHESRLVFWILIFMYTYIYI